MNREEALLESLRRHDDGLLITSDRKWIRGMVLKTFTSLVSEDKIGCECDCCRGDHARIAMRMIEKWLVSLTHGALVRKDAIDAVNLLQDWLSLQESKG